MSFEKCIHALNAAVSFGSHTSLQGNGTVILPVFPFSYVTFCLLPIFLFLTSPVACCGVSFRLELKCPHPADYCHHDQGIWYLMYRMYRISNILWPLQATCSWMSVILLTCCYVWNWKGQSRTYVIIFCVKVFFSLKSSSNGNLNTWKRDVGIFPKKKWNTDKKKRDLILLSDGLCSVC